jgi:hypothetical protein
MEKNEEYSPLEVEYSTANGGWGFILVWAWLDWQPSAEDFETEAGTPVVCVASADQPASGVAGGRERKNFERNGSHA